VKLGNTLVRSDNTTVTWEHNLPCWVVEQVEVVEEVRWGDTLVKLGNKLVKLGNTLVRWDSTTVTWEHNLPCWVVEQVEVVEEVKWDDTLVMLGNKLVRWDSTPVTLVDSNGQLFLCSDYRCDAVPPTFCHV